MQASSKLRRLGWAIAGLGIATCLASCGGDDGDNNNSSPSTPITASNMPPASASADVPGFIAYLKTITPTTPENNEPLDLTGFVAPTSDTTEPDPTV